MAGCLALLGLTMPAMASASNLYVSPSTPSPPYNSCTHPAYDHIQDAVQAPDTTVRVVVLKLPAAPVNSTTSCDTAIEPPYQPNQDEVSICTSGTVSITGLKIEALWPSGTCYDSMYGIFVAGGATLKATGDQIEGAGGASPIGGCQGGVGVEVGTARTEPGEVGYAAFKEDTISGYQKNGITVEGTGSNINVSKTTVTGAGATPAIAQNGIQVSYGGGGTIKDSTITGNECDAGSCGPDSLVDYQSTGVLFYGAANGSSVSASTIDGNDIGVLTESSTEVQPLEPITSQLTVTSNILENDRYESVLVSQGWTTVSKNTMTNGNVGIQLLQYGEESYGPKATAVKDKIGGMADWAVQGYSDNEPTDPFGSITITNSHLSGNPGGTVEESVNSNNTPKLKIYTQGDS
jgi:hypothetical protein